MAIAQTPFTSPGFDYSADIASIERRKRLAEALQGQAFQSIQTPQTPPGGFTPRISPVQGLEKLAQALMSAHEGNVADEKARELSTKAQADYRNVVTSGLAKLKSGDITGALGDFASHPQGQMFVPLAISELSGQRLADALIGGNGQKATPNAAAGATATPSVMAGSGNQLPEWAQTQPTAAPQPAAVPTNAAQAFDGPRPGGPAGGIPMKAWLAQDPSGKTYMEQLAKDYTEANKPIADRGFGLKKWNPNTQKYELVSRPEDITTVKRAELEATAPYEQPITFKTDKGLEVQLFRPEAVEYQRTGRLPTRYGGPGPSTPSAPNAAPSVTPASASPAVPGNLRAAGVNIGTLGLSQSQEEQMRQTSQKAANTAAGTQFIEEQRVNYARLRDAPAMLANIEETKKLIPQAKGFMGPGGEGLLNAAKFLNNRLGTNINVEGVKNTEELRTRVFQGVMENLKKMDASPSTYQQKVMEDALGKISTDPNALPRVLDVFGDIVRQKVDIHNQTVRSAEQRGTTFPHDVFIRLPQKNVVKDVVRSGGTESDPLGLFKRP